jgi:hypothetical protein
MSVVTNVLLMFSLGEVRNAGWREPNDVQVLIQQQEQNRFTVYEL